MNGRLLTYRHPAWSFAWVRNWSGDRWLAIVSLVVGVVTSLYFYELSILAPLLTYTVNSSRFTINRTNFEKDFGITFKGKPLDADKVTAIQIAVWNDGSAPITTSSILEPIKFQTPDGDRIISATIKRVSRSLCEFEIINNAKQLEHGECGMTWKVLEPRDGAIIQLVYVGTRQPRMTGAIMGQTQIQSFYERKSLSVQLIIAAIWTIAFWQLPIRKWSRKIRRRTGLLALSLAFNTCVLAIFGCGLYLLNWWYQPSVPFPW